MQLLLFAIGSGAVRIGMETGVTFYEYDVNIMSVSIISLK